MDSNELYCPEEGLKPRGERIKPPLTKADSEFHIWSGETYRAYLEYHFQIGILLDCWEREQAKRASK